MMSRISLLWVLSLFTLTACAAPAIDEDSRYYRLPAGTVIVLHQDLAVPSGHARVFLQEGKPVEQHRLKPYQPSCNFEQQAVSDGNAVIRADRFTVTGVSAGVDYVVQKGRLVYAGWRLFGSNQSVDKVNRYIRYPLASSAQPQVMRLTCHGGFDFPGRAELPSLKEIRAALGSVATIELPEGHT